MATQPGDTDTIQPQGFVYEDAAPSCAHAYLLPSVTRELECLRLAAEKKRVFDLGCGNGSTAAFLGKRGFAMTGVDPSEEGIRQANQHYPEIPLRVGSAYDDLPAIYGRFPVVISLEVVEHVYFPRKFIRCVHDLLEPGGTAIISTPYHGYWKNLVLAATGKLDSHFTALWNHGHIKFWSIKTFTQLLEEQEFQNIRFLRVGRVKILAKSMIAIARRALS